ncbi:restriction endonuclease subunit S [Vibrio sp. 431]|uniref:restriction endonuclease subunit S n=1 Tax=Vibrio sp. 431 TaxID=3074606 RepID=UPI002963E896|nr:restriction endonuclease subunit S [Vibrio sp. 431]MDW2007777.1 restriction endonuclease subunit S [Vibrio sp. 431]
MVPNGWEKHPVGKLCKSIVPGRNKPKVFDGDIPWVTTPEISGKYIPSNKQKNFISQVVAKECGAKVVPKGAVVIAAVGELGLTAIATEEIILNQQLHAFVCPNDLDNEYLAYFLSAQKPYMNTVASKTTIPYMNKSNCESIPVLLPPLPEQRKIAKTLSTWDKAISTTEKLIETSKQQKKALMQQLLTGKKRLVNPETGKVFEGEWEEFKLGELFAERVETKRDDLPLLSITSSDGVVYQEDTGRKNTSNDDKSKYRRICVNDIGYNTMRMWQGRSSISNKEGIVSPAYTILIPQQNVAPMYASYLFKLPRLVHVFERNSQGLVSDTWNLKYPHFAKIKWSFPCLKEQQKIAAILTAADKEIEVLEAKLSHFKQEKKALMQQLLTGKRRVSLSS